MTTRETEGWWDALGHDVPVPRMVAAIDLLVDNGQNRGEAEIVIQLVAREIRHDNPDRAQRTLRSWLPAYGSETLLLMVLATLAADDPGQGRINGSS